MTPTPEPTPEPPVEPSHPPTIPDPEGALPTTSAHSIGAR